MQDKQLRELIGPILEAAGLELDGFDVTPSGSRRLLRITVDGDGPKGRGPLLDDISAASREISHALDDSPLMGNGKFTLEVTSRGVGKPLTEPKHFRRNRGRLVKLQLAGEQLTGRITAVAGDVVTLDVAGAPRQVDVAEVTQAVVQVEMNPPKELSHDTDQDLED